MNRQTKQRLKVFLQIGFILLLLAGVAVGGFLAKRSQDNRQQASGNCVGFFPVPNVASLSAKLNDTSIDFCPQGEGESSYYLESKATKTSGSILGSGESKQTTSPKKEGEVFTHIFQCITNVTEITLTINKVGETEKWTQVHDCTKQTATATTIASPTPTPSPSPTPVPQVCTAGNADIVFIIDRSDSMNDLESGKKKIDWVKEASQKVVDTYGPRTNGKIRFGVVVFGMKGVASSASDIYAARTLSGLSANYSQVNQTIGGITGTDSGTCIECGLRLANIELEKAPTGTARVAILLSDGGATYTWDREQDRPKAIAAAYASADYGRSKGIRYVTARYGNSSVGDAVMSTIAGSTGYYSYKPTTQEWSTALVGLGEQICKAAPNIATVTQVTTTPAPTIKPTPTPTPTALAVARTTQTLSVATPTPSPTTTTLLALAQSTPTPVPTPTPSPVPSCLSMCTTSAQCPATLSCVSGLCKNPSCSSSATCLCPTPSPSPSPVPTPVPECNSACTTSSDCPSSMSCYLGICRATACTTVSTCLCATPTPTESPQTLAQAGATATPISQTTTSTSQTSTNTTQTGTTQTQTVSSDLDPSLAPVSASTTQTVVLLVLGIILIVGGILLARPQI